MRIKKTPGIVPVTENFHMKWNETLKGTEKKLIELFPVESKKVIAKIQFNEFKIVQTMLKLERYSG